jgi:hypothetical protein
MLCLLMPIVLGGVLLPVFQPTVCCMICCECHISLACCRFFTFFDVPSGCASVFYLSWLPIIGLEGDTSTGLEGDASTGVKVGDCTGTGARGMTISSSFSGISSSPLLVANG